MSMFNLVEEDLTFLPPKEPYQLWFSLGGEPFSLLAGSGSISKRPPSAIPSFQKAIWLAREESDYTETWFSYPNRGFFVIRYCESKRWIEQDRRQIYTTLYPYYANRMIKHQQHILVKMTESIRSITSLLDLDELLKKILENAMAVLPAADNGILMMHDETIGKLTHRMVVGAVSDEFRNMRVRLGEGVSGLTYLDGKPRLYKSREDFLRDSLTHTKVNFDILQKSFDLETFQSAISVPISVGGKTECVLIVTQNGDYPLLTEYELQLIQGFTDQVSIAITNVNLFHDLNRQNQTLLERDKIHATLMNLSLQNKGAVVIVNELKQMIRLPLVFIDLLDYTHYPKLKRGHPHFQINELENKFGASRTPFYHVFQTPEGNQQYYIYPIMAMNVCLGFILVELQTKLTHTQQLVLEQGSRVLALEMMRKQSLTDFYYKKTNELFNNLLLQKDAAILRKKAEELGINYNHSLMVAIFELPSLHDIQLIDLQVHRLVNAIKRNFGQYAPVVFGSRNKVTMLMEITKRSKPSEVIQEFRHFIHEWESEGGTVLRVGLGTSYDDLQMVAKSYNEANKVLTYLALKQCSGITSYSEIGINRLFIHASEEIESLIQEVFGPLYSSEDNRLEETLLVYFVCNGSGTQAAKKLHIHTNTLFQRLRKIEELLNLSLDNAEHKLKLQLACYLRSSNFDKLT
jgi:sugar diacid utilization regulator